MTIKNLSVIFLSLLAVACNKKSEQPKGSGNSGNASAPINRVEKQQPTFVASDSFKVGLGNVYNGYLKVESALAKDDFILAKEEFQSMHGILHMLQSDGLDTLGKVYWDSLDGAFMQVLHPMATSENIAIMRNHLIDFTPLVVKAIEKFGATTSEKAYLFHCPMARNNKGADWIQSDTTKLNPYFGKTMLNCGDFKREISL